ncbi:unnamed protein product, partial [Closterium sp. NIES-54]
ASKACGPLFSWLEAAVQYGEIIRAVQPMRDEMEQLEGEAGSMAEELQHVQCGMKGSGVRDEMEQLEGEAGSMAEELQHVQPMRDEMEQLEGEAGSMAEELQHVQESIGNLEERMEACRDEHSLLLSTCEAMRADIPLTLPVFLPVSLPPNHLASPLTALHHSFTALHPSGVHWQSGGAHGSMPGRALPPPLRL